MQQLSTASDISSLSVDLLWNSLSFGYVNEAFKSPCNYCVLLFWCVVNGVLLLVEQAAWGRQAWTRSDATPHRHEIGRIIISRECASARQSPYQYYLMVWLTGWLTHSCPPVQRFYRKCVGMVLHCLEGVRDETSTAFAIVWLFSELATHNRAMVATITSGSTYW